MNYVLRAIELEKLSVRRRMTNLSPRFTKEAANPLQVIRALAGAAGKAGGKALARSKTIIRPGGMVNPQEIAYARQAAAAKAEQAAMAQRAAATQAQQAVAAKVRSPEVFAPTRLSSAPPPPAPAPVPARAPTPAPAPVQAATPGPSRIQSIQETPALPAGDVPHIQAEGMLLPPPTSPGLPVTPPVPGSPSYFTNQFRTGGEQMRQGVLMRDMFNTLGPTGLPNAPIGNPGQVALEQLSASSTQTPLFHKFNSLQEEMIEKLAFLEKLAKYDPEMAKAAQWYRTLIQRMMGATRGAGKAITRPFRAAGIQKQYPGMARKEISNILRATERAPTMRSMPQPGTIVTPTGGVMTGAPKVVMPAMRASPGKRLIPEHENMSQFRNAFEKKMSRDLVGKGVPVAEADQMAARAINQGGEHLSAASKKLDLPFDIPSRPEFYPERYGVSAQTPGSLTSVKSLTSTPTPAPTPVAMGDMTQRMTMPELSAAGQLGGPAIVPGAIQAPSLMRFPIGEATNVLGTPADLLPARVASLRNQVKHAAFLEALSYRL